MCDIMCKVVTVRVMFFSDMCVCALRHIFMCLGDHLHNAETSFLNSAENV